MRNRRKRKLVKPEIQIPAILFSLAVAAVAVVLQSITLTFSLHRLVSLAPEDGPALAQQLPGMVFMSCLVSLLLLGPLILALVLSVTNKIAGPVYRLETSLNEYLTTGEATTITLRKGDQLQELARLIDGALAARTEALSPSQEKRRAA